MDFSILHIIGYVASIIIALSMTMSSIVKFRIINLAGASLFCVYGILIGALPVALLNGFIAIVDIYYLVRIFSQKEAFDILWVRSDNKYLLRFLDFYQQDIVRFFPGFTYQPERNTHSFFILRNMAVAGLFLGRRENSDILYVALDYVISEYRDFKNGKFIFHRLQDKIIDDGFRKIITRGHTSQHKRYLKKLGFRELENGCFEMKLPEKKKTGTI
ncbi:MAG: hypothetical protein RG741_05255 [Bacteroidales bacterium]|nr:hypothetical protein [Bacteroidales bacterium]